MYINNIWIPHMAAYLSITSELQRHAAELIALGVD